MLVGRLFRDTVAVHQTYPCDRSLDVVSREGNHPECGIDSAVSVLFPQLTRQTLGHDVLLMVCPSGRKSSREAPRVLEDRLSDLLTFLARVGSS